jgi:hypothetical protein
LWREKGREQLESFRLAPWASRRRHDLLQWLDRLNPTIGALSQAIEQEVEKCPEAQRLRTHPGVGPLTALAFVLIIDPSAASAECVAHLGDRSSAAFSLPGDLGGVPDPQLKVQSRQQSLEPARLPAGLHPHAYFYSLDRELTVELLCFLAVLESPFL